MKLIAIILVISVGILSALSGCQSTPVPSSATPIEVPTEAQPGEYVTVSIKVTSNQPYEIILAKNHKTEIENYFAPYTRRTVTYPDNNYVLTFHEQIPIGTIPGDYILKVIQLKSQGDNEGIEIFSKTFFVK
jgi:hypothetical protein